MNNQISVYPATDDRWDDLRKLFGPTGAYWNCWCMYWRYSSINFNNASKDQKITDLKIIVDDPNYVPGLLAYIEGEPVGWIGFSPRDKFVRLLKSRVIKAIDEIPVWSLMCFFIHKKHRNKGVAKSLIKGSVEYAKSIGVDAVETYPVDTEGERLSMEASYSGTVDMFEKAGFKIVGNTKSTTENKSRVIMRYYLK